MRFQQLKYAFTFERSEDTTKQMLTKFLQDSDVPKNKKELIVGMVAILLP